MENLIKLLRNHDWYFEYSDDHKVWQRGVTQRAAINAEAERLGRPELVEQAFEEFKAGDLAWWLAELEEISG
jgi:hypothetical protein|tara:strand:+ start:1475 stop:1690 length:216 start_codon:yes stop_codon:yes gene_type:complete